MSNCENVVGQSIVCYGIGIGEIVDVAPLYDGGEKFYKVSFPKDKCINYFSIKNKRNYRILASQKVLNKAILEFNSKFDKVKYKTIQEKIKTQKEMLKEEDIIKLAKTLSMLKNEKELPAQVSKPFKDSFNTFIDEIVFVLDVNRSEAYSMLGMKAPVIKAKK